MKISRIEIQNFKAFKEPELFDIENKNVLIFGNNGSGKTSFCASLFHFFESSLMQHKEFARRYFHKSSPEKLHNFNGKPEDTYVKITTSDGKEHSLSFDKSPDNKEIKQTIFGSEFISYRLLFSFYHFSSQEDINLFPVFYKDIFPYLSDESVKKTYSKWFNELREELFNLETLKVRVDSTEYKSLLSKVEQFNKSFETKLVELNKPANKLLTETFLKDEDISLKISYKSKLKPERFVFNQPVIELSVKYKNEETKRPQNILNEAKLTSVALSIRLAVFDNRIKAIPLKIVVLDDLLISLDMQNRIKVFNYFVQKCEDKRNKKGEIETEGFQLFIVTHDKSLFNFLSSNIKIFGNENAWKFYEFFESNSAEYPNPKHFESGDYIAKAEKELKEVQNYEVAALYLRKAAEQIMQVHFDPTLEELARFKNLETLATSIQKSEVEREYYLKFSNKVKSILETKGIDEEKAIYAFNQTFTNDNTYDDNDFGKIELFRNNITDFFAAYFKHKKEYNSQKNKLLKTIKFIDELRPRILNAGAHAKEEPLYEIEIIGAIAKLKEFKNSVINTIR